MHRRMRAFSYAWSLTVTWQRWRLHNSICHIQKPYATRKLHGSVFYKTGFNASRSFTLRECDFRPVLLLWPWPWPNDLYIRTWLVFLEIYRLCKYELPTSRLSKVIVWQTDRQTDRQTDTTEIIYHTASRVVSDII